MKRCLFRDFLITGALLAVSACTTLENLIPVREDLSINNQRASIAMTSLKDLTAIDSYVRLDNKALRKEMENGLRAQAATTGVFSFSKLRVRFAQQVITIEASIKIIHAPEKEFSANLKGDIVLTFSGNQLNWLPHFEQLLIPGTDFVFEDVSYPVATEEIQHELLSRVNREIADAIIVLGKNAVQINPVPLGEIEVGTSLKNFGNVSATGIHTLGGVFIVAGSSILIEPDLTSIALDLKFIPSISSCPVDVRVSRSTFASEIVNREPVGINRLLGEGKVLSHFFTEISGATRSTAVIHYWFADGKPVALEELPVEPSFRWRTWSSVEVDQDRARNWEVIVVEKKTGCILHSLAIQAQPMVDTSTARPAPATETFDTFRSEFEARVDDFSILREKPEIALIQVPRAFLTEVLHGSLKDTQITLDFDIDDLPAQKLEGFLRPFGVDNILCEERECTSRRTCDTGYSQCTRKRDSRVCTTCLFRNPLNNRCVNEAPDPICEAAKANQNAAFEAALESCQERELIERMECERRSTQEIRSCEIEAAAEQSVCETNREIVRAQQNQASFAGVYVSTRARGILKAVFSDFSLDDDLKTIRLEFGLKANLVIHGSIRFNPKQALGPLGACINSWQKSFEGRVVIPQQSNGLIGVITQTPTELSTDWSGFQMDVPIHPSPLEAMFVDNPNLLADCGIGLTVESVSKAIEGESRELLAGNYTIEIQPETSHIRLAGASVRYGELVFEAAPELSTTHLRYAIGD